MSLLGGIFGKKSKSTTNSNATSNIDTTTSRTNPQWVTDLAAKFGGGIDNMAAVDPMTRFAGADPLQDKAYTSAMNLGSWAAPASTAPAASTEPVSTAPLSPAVPVGGGNPKVGSPGGIPAEASAATIAEKFAGGGAGAGAGAPPAVGGNPYLKGLDMVRATAGQGPQLFDPSKATGATALQGIDAYIKKFAPNADLALQDYDKGAGQTAAQLMLDQAGSGAFSNSGGLLERAALTNELGLGRAKLADDLRTGTARLAGEFASADADRSQQAGQFNAQAAERALARDSDAGARLADIAATFSGQQRADIGTQAGLGQIYRDIATGQKNVDIDTAQRLEELFSGLPLDLFSGQNTKGTTTTTGNSTTKSKTSDPMGDIAKIAAVIALSDRRLKEPDPVKLYTRPDGLGVYLFSYLGEATKRIGVMAQDVMRVRPEAVLATPDGWLAVDYGRL